MGRVQAEDGEASVATGHGIFVGSAVVTVVAKIYNCGCVTSHTEAGYLAVAAFCEEALPIERERLALRSVQRQTELEDPALDELIPALEDREALLESHRCAAGVAETVVRTSDPDLLPGEVPAVVSPATVEPGTEKGVSP